MKDTKAELPAGEKTMIKPGKKSSFQTVPVRRSSADWFFSRPTPRSQRAAGIRFVKRRRWETGP
jgi:hypothetical protein